MATGRSDYPNQVNNVLGFPFIFRGALDVTRHGDQRRNEDCGREGAGQPGQAGCSGRSRAGVRRGSASNSAASILFRSRLIHASWSGKPRPLPKAAMKTGVARKPIDIDEYKHELGDRIGKGRVIMNAMLIEAPRRARRRIVFPEGTSSAYSSRGAYRASKRDRHSRSCWAMPEDQEVAAEIRDRPRRASRLFTRSLRRTYRTVTPTILPMRHAKG